MSSNNRIFYACQGVAIANMGTPIGSYGTANMLHGMQQIGMTTNFKLEQAFELGQIEIYENIEGVPEVEVTMEKVIDGYPLIYLIASTGVTGTSNSGLVARSKQRCDVRLGIFDEAANHISASTSNGGAAEVEVFASGMYISNVSYKIPTEGNCTESVSFVGNNKMWLTGTGVAISQTMAALFNGSDVPPGFNPLANSPLSGVVMRRQHVVYPNCVLPVSVKGTVGSGVGNAQLNGVNQVHLQSVNISTDFSRNDLLELGRKTPYYRPANFPIEVKCDIEAITTSGDWVSGLENGNVALYNTATSGDNTQQETIFFYLLCGIGFDLGTKNRLSSVSYGGGDATGGNVSTTYSYINYNSLDVYQSGHNNVIKAYGGP